MPGKPPTKKSKLRFAHGPADTVRDMAGFAERAARRLLRRTRNGSPTRPSVPLASVHDQPLDTPAGQITLLLPAQPSREEQLQARIDVLERRLARAEHAASWLRARLRTAQSRRPRQRSLNGEALVRDLGSELARLRSRDSSSIQGVVMRVLASHGLPVASAQPRPTAQRVAKPGARQSPREALARQVIQLTPEVADVAYVYRVLDLLAEHGQLSPAALLQTNSYSSAIGRRRLRLAAEALARLTAIDLRDGCYRLNQSSVALVSEMRSTPQQPPRTAEHGQSRPLRY